MLARILPKPLLMTDSDLRKNMKGERDQKGRDRFKRETASKLSIVTRTSSITFGQVPTIINGNLEELLP